MHPDVRGLGGRLQQGIHAHSNGEALAEGQAGPAEHSALVGPLPDGHIQRLCTTVLPSADLLLGLL